MKLSNRLLAAVVGLGLTGAVRADIAGPLPVGVRVAQSRAVVAGKVTKIEPKTVTARGPYGTDKVEYWVAVVKVDEAILGVKGLTHVKVGFLPRSSGAVARGRPRTDLKDGEEVLLYLSAHPTEAFYLAPQFFDVTYKAAETAYDKELKEARRMGKLLADPKAGLESKDAAERFLTAALLIHHYRAPRHYSQTPKTEPIGAEESKRILEVLAESDWSRNEPHRFAEPNPAQAFMLLGLTPADGWKQPANFQELPGAAKKWLKENADKYRVKRVVVEQGVRE